MKCTSKAFCSTMESKLQLDNSQAKGLSALVLFNMKTRTTRTAGVVYKTSARDRGVVLNVCPWCAAPINFLGDGEVIVQPATGGAA